MYNHASLCTIIGLSAHFSTEQGLGVGFIVEKLWGKLIWCAASVKRRKQSPDTNNHGQILTHQALPFIKYEMMEVMMEAHIRWQSLHRITEKY